ncbi:MAG: hypothetical protein IJ341_00275 [Bacteroidales bacterium]|nr:hypothetical protein [Bacteroidales bacterium]
MTNNQLHIKVRHILDEVEMSGNFEFENSPELYARIEEMIAPSLREVLLAVPLFYLKKKELEGEIKINQDGSGEMKLPDDFRRLVAFKMDSWRRTVYSAIDESSPLFPLQDSMVTRGGTNRPVVAITSDGYLRFWSVPPFQRNPKCEIKEYVADISSVNDLDERLSDLLAWQVAKNVAISYGQDVTILDNKVKEIIELL